MDSPSNLPESGEALDTTFFTRRLFLRDSYKMVSVDGDRMWLRTCQYYAKHVRATFRVDDQSTMDDGILLQLYSLRRIYEERITSRASMPCRYHYEDGVMYVFDVVYKNKKMLYLHAIVPKLACRTSTSLVGYTTDYPSATLREEIACAIGREINEELNEIQYRPIHIPTLLFKESIYTILHNTCFSERKRLQTVVNKNGRRCIDKAAQLTNIRQDPQDRLRELEQLFKTRPHRRGEAPILLVLYGIDEMVISDTALMIS